MRDRVRVLRRQQDAHPTEGRRTARLGQAAARLARCREMIQITAQMRVLVAANKADAVSLESDAGEFHSFGFADVFAISAEHGNGIGELLDTLEPELQGSSPSVRG